MITINKELSKINKEVLCGKDITLMGRLEHVETMIEFLKSIGIKPAAIWDNNVGKQGCVVSDVRIQAPALKKSEKNLIIIYSPRHWESMRNQLVDLGYADYEEIIVLCRPSMERAIEMASMGENVLEQLDCEFGCDTHYFLLNCPLGDFYLLGLYLKRYCQIKEIDKYAVIGNSLGIEKLSEWFGINNRRRLDEETSAALVQLWKLVGEEESRIQPLTVWQGDFRHNPCITRQIKGMTFMDTFRHYVFSLSDKEKPQYPEVLASYKLTEKEIKQLGIEDGNTVVLVPYSYSIHTLQDEFWQRLVDELVKMGYKVVVNEGEDREKKVFKNASSIRIGFQHMNQILEYAGNVVGIRCGFFDITSQAKCNRVVLYYDKTFQNVKWNRTDMEFCSLNAMGLTEKVQELIIEEFDVTIENIVACLTTDKK